MQQRLLTLHCLSPLHCGTGQGIAGIDLPVIRERHSGWPLVPSSSIKGVLRDTYREHLVAAIEQGKHAWSSDGASDYEQRSPQHRADAESNTTALFGPEPRAASTQELGLGALIFGDAMLMAFPVRSLVGVFALCTCPLALHRLGRITGESIKVSAPSNDQMLGNQALVAAEGQVVLEDHALTHSGPVPQAVLDLFTRLLGPEHESFLQQHLAVLPDDLFSWFAQHATQVEARIALNPATKTVNEGQLFYEETVPPESIFVAPLAAEDARHHKVKNNPIAKAEAALAELSQVIDKQTLQFGGKATIGRGQCAVHLSGGK